jgi:carboxyl-terminal processing protease
MGLIAVGLIVVSAAAVFAAGLSLGGLPGGRDDEERTAIEAFIETYRRIDREFVGESEPGELLEGAINGMFDTLDDPYSAYMPPEEYESTLSGISGEFEGIGARMSAEDAEGVTCEPISVTCELRVIDVLAESPALDAGLMENDIVEAVDARSLTGQTIDDAVLLIRGPRGSEVTLTLDRGGQQQDLTIRRDVIVSQDVRSAVLADGEVGYLRVDSFSSSAAEDFEEALREQIDAGIEQFVLDVRDDPGGFVDAAVSITSQFLDDGAVFWEEDADGTQRSVDVEPGGLAADPAIELIVLVDDGSASASEILAGALQDDGRARLVGTRTFGKGTVQEWTQLPGQNGGFRLSVAKWLTRDKDWVHGSGLTPDVIVESGDTEFRPGDPEQEPAADAQLARALALLLGQEATPDRGPSAAASELPLASPSPATSVAPSS